MFRFDERRLLNGYIGAFPKQVPKPAEAAAAGRLLGFIGADPDLQDVRWAAYMLATVKHECADTWMPIVERGSRQYFLRYDADTQLGRQLGNVKDGDGFLFRGRGYVQITGRSNYERLGRLIGIGDKLVEDPDLALDAGTAYRIMSVGMRKGAFTGKKLADYIGESACDYVNARRIINGLDRAEQIAGYAATIERVLRDALLPS